MSARGHGRPPQPVLGWALLVIAAALIGGLAAARLVRVPLLVAVLVSVAAGAITAFAALRWPSPPPPAPEPRPAAEPRPARRPEFRPDPAPQPRPQREAAADGLAAAEPVVQMLPASPGAWWDAAGPPAPGQAAQRVPAPDLSSYLDSTVIAQCPNCGAFRLDFRRARHGWDFRCDSCRYTWNWQSGTAWPAVRVAPARRSGSRP